MRQYHLINTTIERQCDHLPHIIIIIIIIIIVVNIIIIINYGPGQTYHPQSTVWLLFRSWG